MPEYIVHQNGDTIFVEIIEDISTSEEKKKIIKNPECIRALKESPYSNDGKCVPVQSGQQDCDGNILFRCYYCAKIIN